jgi:hypothetical protein
MPISEILAGEIQLPFFLKNIPTPIKAGMSRLIMKRNIDALNPTEALSPICVKKYTEAPSLIPSSPIDIGGMTVFANIIRLAAHK